MSNKIRWGIVSTGRIAHQFAQDFEFVNNGILQAVSSRSRESANRFAGQYRIPSSYSNYAEMLADDQVDAVYIATPHNHHFENAAGAIAAGKAVLCEKPLTIDPEECHALTRLATDAGVYVMEAMWTYFLPAIQQARTWVNAGRIGRILHLKADFGYPLPYDGDRREYRVENAGGCLLEMGIYPVALAWLFLQQDADRIHSVIHHAPNGVEDDVVTVWEYPDAVATLATSFRAKLQNWAYVIGEKGYIAIPDFWRASECHLYQLDTLVDQFKDGRASLGFNYEAIAVADDLFNGRLQSSTMPLATSLRLQQHMARVKNGNLSSR